MVATLYYFVTVQGMKEISRGREHPIPIVINEIVAIFGELGFVVEMGPELELQKYNFDMLNFPAEHPARDMQDTFFIKNKPEYVLRTHTSNTQTRFMEQASQEGRLPPYAIVVPGKVFRNESTDATHEMQFHQFEGLMVGEDISVAHLKGVLLEFFKRYFGTDAEIRLRPSFFPFVEPGFEIDVKTDRGWMEVLGAGMVHPNVLDACGVDSQKYSGFAFGMGVDRIVMQKYGIPDVRYLYQGDLRLNQW